MFTQDILPVGKDMLVGTRTRGVWRSQRNLDDELKYFKGEPWGGKELENKNVRCFMKIASGIYGLDV